MVNAHDLDPEDVKALLRKKYRALQSFERQSGLPVNSVSAALRRPHRRAEQAIARALETTAAKIWPSRYDDRGQRHSPQPAGNYASARGSRG